MTNIWDQVYGFTYLDQELSIEELVLGMWYRRHGNSWLLPSAGHKVPGATLLYQVTLLESETTRLGIAFPIGSFPFAYTGSLFSLVNH